MDLGLTDRVFLVTGGARGLGRATADVLVAEGARVVLSGRTEESLAAAAAALGDHASYVVADNADPDAPAGLIDEARRRWGRLDGALISVGGPPTGPVTRDHRRPVDDVVRGGLPRAPSGWPARCRPRSVRAGRWRWCCRPACAAPLPDMAVSNGLRPGLAMLTKQLADELGPRGIRVNGLLPGRVAHRAGGRARRAGRRPRGRQGRRRCGRSRWAATASRQSSAVPRRSCSAPPRRSSPASCSPSTGA